VQSRSELDKFVAAAVDALRDRSGSGGPRVAFACGVWSDLSCPLKPGFREAVVDGAYRAEASAVDFRGDRNGACRMINAWVERATNGLIENILSPESVGPLTRVVLGNAVYFKGSGSKPSPRVQRRMRRSAGWAAPAPSTCPSCRAGRSSSSPCTTGFKVLQLWYKKPKKPAPFFPNRAPLVNPYAAPSSQIPLIFRQGRRP
jgi:serpin B